MPVSEELVLWVTASALHTIMQWKINANTSGSEAVSANNSIPKEICVPESGNTT